MTLAIGDTFRVSAPMSGRVVLWTVEEMGQREVRLSGIWYRNAQVKRWIAQGSLIPTNGAYGAKEQS